jgi:hypothetical protein
MKSNEKGNSFTDTNVQADGGFLGQPKKYYYRVIARDTQATDESLATKESSVLTVSVKNKEEEKEEKVPCNEFGLPIGCEKQDNGGQDNGQHGPNGGEKNGDGDHKDGGNNNGPTNGGGSWWNGGSGKKEDE